MTKLKNIYFNNAEGRSRISITFEIEGHLVTKCIVFPENSNIQIIQEDINKLLGEFK